MEWASRLQSPAGYRGSGEKGNRLSTEDGDFSFGELGSEYMYMYSGHLEFGGPPK